MRNRKLPGGVVHAVVVLVMLAGILGGCQTAYYAAWEQLGREKRDLLRRDVAAVKAEQQETGEEFQDALDRLRSVYGSTGSPLERRYDDLRSAYESAESQADDLRSRIRSAETVAGDLFEEWQAEIKSMESASLRRSSEQKLARTRERWKGLHAAMLRSEKSMDPVLTQLRDQVLFLKHNLNAQALGTLEAEARSIDRDVSVLVTNLKRSIAEADSFLSTLGTE
jgi:Protein of unknown function (DUF2959)